MDGSGINELCHSLVSTVMVMLQVYKDGISAWHSWMHCWRHNSTWWCICCWKTQTWTGLSALRKCDYRHVNVSCFAVIKQWIARHVTVQSAYNMAHSLINTVYSAKLTDSEWIALQNNRYVGPVLSLYLVEGLAHIQHMSEYCWKRFCFSGQRSRSWTHQLRKFLQFYSTELLISPNCWDSDYHLINICAAFHWSPSTEYRVVISCGIFVNGKRTVGSS